MTYKYKCPKCNDIKIITCSMSELIPPKKCKCGGEYYQEFGTVGVVWKTDGAYGKGN